MGIISSITSFGGNVWSSATGAAQTAYSTYVAPTVVTVARPVSTAVSTVTRPVTTAVQQQVVQPIQQRVIQPVQQQVQTRVIQPVQQRVIQPVQRQVIQPAVYGINLAPKVITSVVAPRVIQPVQQRVIQPVQQRVVQPALAGINLAPKIVTAVAPRVIQPVKTTVLATPGKITSAVIAGASTVPGIRSTQISVTQPVAGGSMGGINTRPSLNILGAIPAAGGKLVSTGLGAVTSLKSAAGAGIRGAGNVTMDIFGRRTAGIQQGYAGLQQRADVLNVTGTQIATKFAGDAMEANWLKDNVTRLNTFGGQIEQNATRINRAIGDFNKLPAPTTESEYNARVARANELVGEGDKLGAMVGQYDAEGNRLNVWNQTMVGKEAENRALARAYANETASFNQTAMQLETQKKQVESTGAFGIAGWWNRQNEKVSGIYSKYIPAADSKYVAPATFVMGIATAAGGPFAGAGEYIGGKIGQNLVSRISPSLGAASKAAPTLPEFRQMYFAEKYTGIREKPLTQAAFFGIGVAGAAVGGVVSASPKLTGVAAKGVPIIGQRVLPVVGKMTYGKAVVGAMGVLYGGDIAREVAIQPSTTDRFRVLARRASTEIEPMMMGGLAYSYAPGALRGAYQATARAGTRIIETRPFQSASKSLTGGWERAFGRISPSKVTFTPGRGIKRPGVDPVRMVFQRDTGVWVPTTKQPSVTGRYTLGQRGKSPVGGTPKRGSSSMDIPENVLARVRSMAAQSPGKERTAIFGETWKQKWVPQIGTKKTTSFIPRSGKALFHSHPKGTVSPSRADLKGLSYEYEGIVTPKGDILVMKRPPGGWPKGDALSSAISSKGVRPALREFGIQKMFIEAPPAPKSPTMKMNWNRATGKWQPAASQAKSRWDFLRVDRASFAKAQPKTYSESNWRFIEANRPSVMSDLTPGTGWLGRPARATRSVFIRSSDAPLGVADRGQALREAAWQRVYDRPYSKIPGSEVYSPRDPKIDQFFARQAVRSRRVTSPFEDLPKSTGRVVDVNIPRLSSRQMLADRYPTTPLETQVRVQSIRQPRTPSQTKSVQDIAPKTSPDEWFTQTRLSTIDSLTTPSRLPSFPRESPTSAMTMKIGANRVFPTLRGTETGKVRVSEGMKTAVSRGRGNIFTSQFGTPEPIRGDVFEYNTGLGPVRLVRSTKPRTGKPLSEIFGKPPAETGAKPSSATAIVIPKEKPVSPPSTPKEMGRSTVMQDMNRALGSDTVLARAPTGKLAPGETLDASGLQLPGARRRRPLFFDDDTVAAYGPLALGGSGTAAVSNLRDQYDTATDRARGSFSGISIIPSIALVGETGLGSRTITTPTLSVKPPEPQKYDPIAVPKLRIDPLRAQAPSIASITAPKFATGQIPGLGQLNLQTPAIGQLNLQMPAMDQPTLQQPVLDQMQIQRPVLDTFTYQVPAFEPPALPPFEFPPMPIPVIPPFTPPPMAGAGGGGGGGIGGFRTGMEFVETMPLGDFLSDTFGGAGLDFGGMNDVSSASFMSGAWGGAKPKKTKRRKR